MAPERIVECGMPVDPAFIPSADKPALRARLGLESDLPVLLVNFGGSGKMKPRQVVSELRRIQQPFQVVFIARRDERLREELLQPDGRDAPRAHSRAGWTTCRIGWRQPTSW